MSFDPAPYFLRLKGKQYLPVAPRIQWFRTDHPDGYMRTEIVHADYQAGLFVVRAEVGWHDGDRHIYATAHKSETVKDFAEAIEKSETGAVGRALALLGYGTLQALELEDDGERIVDSPQEHRPAPARQAAPRPAPAATGGKESQPAPANPADAWLSRVTATKDKMRAAGTRPPYDEPGRKHLRSLITAGQELAPGVVKADAAIVADDAMLPNLDKLARAVMAKAAAGTAQEEITF